MESTETGNAIHFELHTFRIFHIMARPAAFVSTLAQHEIHMTIQIAKAMQARSSALCIPTSSKLEFIIN